MEAAAASVVITDVVVVSFVAAVVVVNVLFVVQFVVICVVVVVSDAEHLGVRLRASPQPPSHRQPTTVGRRGLKKVRRHPGLTP